jgi:hypothetical protein
MMRRIVGRRYSPAPFRLWPGLFGRQRPWLPLGS